MEQRSDTDSDPGTIGSPLIGIVLAAGRGTRMRSRTPKVLHTVGGVPLVGHAARALVEAGCSTVVFVTGFGAEAVEAAVGAELPEGVEAIFARQDPPRGTGDAVARALAVLPRRDGTVLITNGDLPLLRGSTLTGLLRHHRDAGAALTVLALDLEDPRGYGRMRVGPDGEILGVVEEQDATEAERRIRTVNGGLYAAELGDLAPALTAWCSAEEARLQEGGEGPAEIYFPPILGPIREAGGRVQAAPLPCDSVSELQQVNDRVELARAESLLRARLVAAHQRAGVTVVDPSQTWIECDVEIGPETTIHPGSVLRRGVRVGAECEIGPHAHLREGTVLEDDVKIGNFVEVKRSTIGRGTRAKHLTYLGNGEIGRGVNIGAGTVLANYDGERKSTTVIEDGAFIGSGTIIVAPARIGAGARTGAGAVVTRGSEVPAGETVLGVPARARPIAPEVAAGGAEEGRA